MPRAVSEDVEIYYETFGDPGDAPLILISGLGAQLLFWKEEFCDRLVRRGFHVIRFDNRDVGLSTHLDEFGIPDVGEIRAGRTEAPYSLEDMADDTVAVLEAAGVAAAHVVGISLGGYVGQAMALKHPGRVLSLASMMAGVGGDDNAYGGYPHRAEDAEPAADEEARIERRLREIEWMSTPEHFDREQVREDVIRSMERSVSPGGAARQTAAVHGGGSRAAALADVRIPTLVIHGRRDPSLLVVNAHRTATAIPGSKLIVFDDLGHEFPPTYWETMIDLIAENAAAADAGKS